MNHKPTKAKLFQALTWNDLTEWAGETMITRGKDYQRSHKITKLAHTPDGGLIAWVTGSEQYVT